MLFISYQKNSFKSSTPLISLPSGSSSSPPPLPQTHHPGLHLKKWGGGKQENPLGKSLLSMLAQTISQKALTIRRSNTTSLFNGTFSSWRKSNLLWLCFHSFLQLLLGGSSLWFWSLRDSFSVVVRLLPYLERKPIKRP